MEQLTDVYYNHKLESFNKGNEKLGNALQWQKLPTNLSLVNSQTASSLSEILKSSLKETSYLANVLIEEDAEADLSEICGRIVDHELLPQTEDDYLSHDEPGEDLLGSSSHPSKRQKAGPE